MKINTNELEGAALDWAAAVAEERNVGVWSVDEQREWFLTGTSPGTSKALHKIHQSFRPIVCNLREDGVKVPYPRIAYSSDPAQAWPDHRPLQDPPDRGGRHVVLPHPHRQPERARRHRERPDRTGGGRAVLRGVQARGRSRVPGRVGDEK